MEFRGFERRRLWGEHPTSNHISGYYNYYYESTCSLDRVDALVWRRRILPGRTNGRRRWVWTHFAYPSGFVFYRRSEPEITKYEVLTGRSARHRRASP